MERLISLFKRPEDFEFFESHEDEFPWPQPDTAIEPEYFVQLMQYLRDRKETAVREGAD